MGISMLGNRERIKITHYPISSHMLFRAQNRGTGLPLGRQQSGHCSCGGLSDQGLNRGTGHDDDRCLSRRVDRGRTIHFAPHHQMTFKEQFNRLSRPKLFLSLELFVWRSQIKVHWHRECTYYLCTLRG